MHGLFYGKRGIRLPVKNIRVFRLQAGSGR